jgi:hypothetical protein
MDIYSTAALVGVVPNLKLSQNWLLDSFFPNIVESDKEAVAIDVDVGLRRMAPFVSPLVAGKLVESRRMQTNEFKPAYIKDKRAPDLRKPVRRQIGERVGGELSAGEREMINLQLEMADQIDILNRRLEWMASSALCTGTVTIKGDGFPPTLIDFQRDPALTIALSSGARWTPANIAAETASPTTDLDNWATLVLKKSGAVVTDVVFTTKSWQAFTKDPVLKTANWYPGQGGAGNSIQLGTQVQRGAVSKGVWGQYRLWLYNDWYIDPEDGVEKPMIPDGGVVLTGPDLQGTRAFGAIMDPDFNYGAMAYAPKSWVEKDPAQRLVLMQSSPVVIPSRANGALFAQVN